MARTKTSAEKRTDRPITVEADKSINIRLPGKLLEAIETWASTNETSRAEAIRRLIERGLAAPNLVDPYAAFDRAIARLKEPQSKD